MAVSPRTKIPLGFVAVHYRRNRLYSSGGEIQTTLKLLVRKADIVKVDTVLDVVPDDPKDNHVLACAFAGKVDMVVSGDKDLLRLKEYEGIPIVRPMDFLRTVGNR
jgi:putative PIN family toxin of toxin-antitoxin system